VPYEAILSPLIVGYSLLLAMYLVFTIFLPPLLLRDINAQAVDEEELPEEEAGGGSGVIEAVSQQLAPPVLVQHSSTLFRRMGNTAMFERFMGAPNTAPVPVAPSTPGKVNEGSSASPSPEMRVADVEAGEAEAGEAESGEAASEADWPSCHAVQLGSAAAHAAQHAAAEAASGAVRGKRRSKLAGLERRQTRTWIAPHAKPPCARTGGGASSSSSAAAAAAAWRRRAASLARALI
jgi:hypothetical protein